MNLRQVFVRISTKEEKIAAAREFARLSSLPIVDVTERGEYLDNNIIGIVGSNEKITGLASAPVDHKAVLCFCQLSHLKEAWFVPGVPYRNWSIYTIDGTELIVGCQRFSVDNFYKLFDPSTEVLQLNTYLSARWQRDGWLEAVYERRPYEVSSVTVDAVRKMLEAVKEKLSK